jgi:ABC-type cobalamin/Fe3+-siderophores transport system ATPase subunit
MLVLAAIGWKDESKKIERVRQMLKFFELEQIEEKGPQQLTQVERIKIHLARAVLNNPTILLLDGILDSIDEASQDDLMRLVEQYKNINKVTVLLATAHYQLTNRYSPDRIIVCKDKQIMEL